MKNSTKKLFLTLLCTLMLATVVYAGTTTTNGYFYLPALGATGATERATWAAIQQTADTAIKANTDKTTNATHTGEVTGSAALTIADSVTVTGWTLGTSSATVVSASSSFYVTGDNDAFYVGASQDASIYWDATEAANVINSVATTFTIFNNQSCIVLETPDGTYSQCCADDSNTFTCVAK